jgi:hypothetical protein
MLQVSVRSDGYALSASRIDRIVEGVLRDDKAHATQMGLFDRFADFFWRGGAKESAIREAFEYLSENKDLLNKELAEDSPTATEATCAHIVALALWTKGEHRDKLDFSVDSNRDSWHYKLKLDDVTVVDGELPSSAYRTRNMFTSLAIRTSLRNALEKVMDGKAAATVSVQVDRQFQEMDEKTRPEMARSAEFTAWKIRYIKDLLASSHVASILPSQAKPIHLDVSVEHGPRSIANISIAGSPMCKIADYGDGHYIEWLEVIHSIDAKRPTAFPFAQVAWLDGEAEDHRGEVS